MVWSESGAIRLGSGLVMALDSEVHLGSFLDLVCFCQVDAAYCILLIFGRSGSNQWARVQGTKKQELKTQPPRYSIPRLQLPALALQVVCER